MDFENLNIRLAATFLAGVIVGVGSFAIINSARDAKENVAALSTINATTTAAFIEGSNGVIVPTNTAGKTVALDQVVLSKPGWVAIHDDVNGTPGRILGAKLFDSGKSNGYVELLRATVPGTSYFAVLHNDDGNYKNFNVKTDTILKNESGAIIMTKFTTEAR